MHIPVVVFTLVLAIFSQANLIIASSYDPNIEENHLQNTMLEPGIYFTENSYYVKHIHS